MKKYSILFLLMMSCTTAKIQQATQPGFFDKEGHRGCRGLMPENTIPAFLKAIELGVTTLEMDAVITKDSQVLISHDPYINQEFSLHHDGTPVTAAEEKTLNIYQMTYAETQQYDVGMKFYPRFPNQQKIAIHKPKLSAVIDAVEAYTHLHHLPPVQYNIETKSTDSTDGIFHPDPASFVRLIMNIVEAKGIASRVIIQSFDIRTLQYLHHHYPAIKTALLVEPPMQLNFAAQLKQLGFIPTIYSPDYSMVTPLLVKQCRDLGIALIPWTVDDLPTMERLKKMGVNGLISDYPDLYKKLK
ncbi:MAG: glycerophosphodiester phosphodiesterase [Sphingobacteriales bacterium]|uniref:glycerophosphodiester phosphodiesterase family protein n=1 Tax=Hydrotalea flava TaxID=714549 RepID=UPI00083317C3|nr:glycerophosphodiester phosphodiesterase family protein [Hydrotalea flava]RTL55093.1 MAG: glycerophosphodiester phosphodiesterase [Sphingobacteriales bacterium]